MMSRRVAGLRITNKPCVLAIIVFLVLPFGLTQHTDEHYIVEPTPALRLGEDDLTTVLLVNNDNRTDHGRFLNVRPAVGVLTSTARTFIQEGVTTEYATQVLGTTLENGRLYAQLLKKSSRVLYDKENVITPSVTVGGVVHTSIVGEGPHHNLYAHQPKSLLQSHNDLVADKDWQDVDDRLILEKNSFVGNTDYIDNIPRASQIYYPVKEASFTEGVQKQEAVALNKNPSLNRSPITMDVFKIKANKVQPTVDLPTFTVKNMFSPSGFSWESAPVEGGENQQSYESNTQTNVSEQRSPKLLYHQVMKDERPLSTVTYYGFADFTTIVGDSVIVFSPSTSAEKMHLGQVTSIKGEATLGRQESSYVTNVAITITQDLIEPTFVVPMLSTDVSDLQIRPKDMRVRTEENVSEYEQMGHEEEIEVTTLPQEQQVEFVSYEVQKSVEVPKKETPTEEIEQYTTIPPSTEEEIYTTNSPLEEKDEVMPNLESPNVYDEHFILSSSMTDFSSETTAITTPEPSQEETTSRVMLSRPSDEEILRIYSSLASVEAAKKSEMAQASVTVETTTESVTEPITTTPEELPTTPATTTTEEPIEPDVKTHGGMTTIFFEDDPFLGFVSPSSTETITLETQIHVQTSVSTESTIAINEPVSTTAETPVEEQTNSPLEPEIEAVTEEIPVTEQIESKIEATTTIPEAIVEERIEEEKKQEEQTESKVAFKPIVKEIDENEQVEGCIRTSQVFLTQVPKTLTYYTTFFIPNEEKDDETSTSIETNIVPSFDIAQATKHYCIQPTQVVNLVEKTEVPVLERPSKPEESNIIDPKIEELLESTTPIMIVRENAEVTESSDIDASGAGYDDEEEEEDEEEDDDLESGEEIELIYKTLYTTYTYLTTFFHDSTTSVSSRKEILTNIITSSLGMEHIQSSESANIEPTALLSNEVTPTVSVGIGRPTAKFVVQSSDLVKIDSILGEENAEDVVKPTVQLDDSKIAKTYFTTYTYYTTIFVEGETEVMSRTEVHTNVVGKAESSNTHSVQNFHVDEKDNAVIDIRPTATYDTIQRTAISSNEVEQNAYKPKYTTLNRGVQELESSASSSSSRSERKIVPIEDNSFKMLTDIHSTSSNGDQLLVENGVFDDQISSESNTDEIVPSATLLLQTSFTTFTYYTTMYGSDATNVISRLETVTNVVTETLQPTKTINPEEATLPITYFTTFTYWTKLAKDGDVTTLSREETVSNVVTPTLSDSEPSSTTAIAPIYMAESSAINTSSAPASAEVQEKIALDLEPTTYYTTYTYYTTSYAGDQTITDSRFETVTNVITPSIVADASRASAVTEEIVKSVDAVPNQATPIEPPTVLSYDYKTIVDAEGISTLYYRTEILATTIDGVATEVTSSTSTINIDEIKKALSTTTQAEGGESTRTYKTGLVRLIDGTKLANHTTTIYQSKVIGTIIDQRYAQIIESTSSFIIEKTQATPLSGVPEISATATLSPTSVQPTAFNPASSSNPIESSIGDAADQETNQEDGEEEDENDSDKEDDDNGRPRTRLSFQTKKKTFTPVIRPFASRNRPQFAPKRKNLLPSSATIITRSDFTPTITATPALKSESRGRFSSSRKTNAGLSSSSISGSSAQGGKRFSRPSKSSQGGFGSSSRFPGSSRNSIQSSRSQGLSSSFGGGFASSRRSGIPFRGGSSSNIRSFSSSYAGNSRQRIRPSSSLPYDSAPNTDGYTTLSTDSAEEDGFTQRYESEEELDVTTENQRKNNPLLRFRRPQVSRPPFQPGQRNTPTNNKVSTRRNPLTPKPKTTSTTTTTTTTNRPRPRAFQRPVVGTLQNRPRPQNNLFPPRRLFQPQNQAIDEEQKTGDDFQDNEEEESDSAEYDNEEEEEEDEQDAVNRRRRESLSKRLQIKKRTKRQATNFRNRFRRPSLTTKPAPEEKEDSSVEEPQSTVRSRASSRFTPRTHSLPTTTHVNTHSQPGNGRAIRPTKPNANSRAQFTLREGNTTPKLASRSSSNFRRPMPNGGRRTTTAATRPKNPRLKAFGNSVTESTHYSSTRGKTPSSRSRSTSRGRSRNDFVTDPAIPLFDGTLTVTHTTPNEITIPVINGKVTEYKNVLTTTTSIEVLSPNQYTSIVGQNGASTIILNREATSVKPNGNTEVTQFILHEFPTTSVVFTPTTIRGRKTSFAHVIPSTAYQVENVVSTMQAQLAANAPLANILLSQLLLGNIGNIGLNQANINPLLGLGGPSQAVSQVPGEPVTEFKTSSSTYVTTVTNGKSTIIPLTFHGKEILTTIYDSSSEVITATEYFTETIVTTPTQQAQQAQQVNSLLLPLLLQQQLQQQPQQPLPIQNSIPPQLFLSDNLQDLDNNGIQKYNDYHQDIEEFTTAHDELDEASQNTHTTRKSGSRKKSRKSNKQHAAAAPSPSLESSVITLYVSGRRPGEFSTVLSTVQIGGDSTLRKRQINRVQPRLPVLKSDSLDYEDFYESDGSEIQEYLLPASSSQVITSNSLSEETQSLESIVGDVSLWYAKTSAQYGTPEPDINTNRQQPQQQNTQHLNAMFDSQHETPSIILSPISKSESTESGRFFHFGSFDIGPPISTDSTYPSDDDDADSMVGPTGIAEEARYNLATRVMSNGVEVIIAGDKNGKGKPNGLRILPSLSRKPMTLAPSTLQDQMILVVPSNAQENYTIPVNSNHFITKTCLTTYTYRTTYLQDGKTTVESREKVVSNTATEERNYLKISPTESLGVTLSRTPELAIGVFHTTYTYYNTIIDGDLPLVVSSQHVLTNTITGPDDYISFLQPSEQATPVLETNTYFSKISLTKTLKESDNEKIISTSNILTQVIVTESLPPRSTAIMTSYIAFDIDETTIQEHPGNSHVDTQFQTYTYYNSEKDNNGSNSEPLLDKSNPIEKSYLYLKKDSTQALEKTSPLVLPATSMLSGSLQSDMHIYATKTYLTTFTYFTTLMNTFDNVASSTVVNFHTRVIENVITESIPSFMIDENLLSKFETQLKNTKNHNSYITMVTLAGGQSLEITAINMLHHPTTTKTITTKTENTEKEVTVRLEPTASVSSASSIASITPPPIENSNDVLDSDIASSEIEEQYVESESNFPKNSTKTTGTAEFPSVNQIIGSLNLNRLQALGPVFNAMAGLIQNNFGTSHSNDPKKNTTIVNVESKHSAKNISAYDVSAQMHDGPIYIPVQNVHGDSKDVKVTRYISPQSLHISPPDTDWFLDEKKNRGKLELISAKPTYETPLLNGGIPISPGEVITANSDVIVGKPNGIQPRIPFNSKNSDPGNALMPPPPYSYQFQYQQHPKQTNVNQNPILLEPNNDKQMNFDGILKPPPQNPSTLHHQQQQHQQQNMKKLLPHNAHNYRVHYATGHMHQPQHIPMQGHHHHHQQDYSQQPKNQRPGHFNPDFKLQHNNSPRPISPKPNYIPYAPHDYDQTQPQNEKKKDFDLNKELHNNEILEIKQIPEIYSTDLPGTESRINTASNSLGSGSYKTLIKKVINSDKPMLVNIRPSQITNIVIPRDNAASILIVESAVELHKNGQYYDEPNSYPDALVTSGIAQTQPPPHVPILSNQQVNLDMNVLSHNVDINVPPITFNKDTDFPHSTPVRGQIQKNEPTNFHMPHVTIPHTDSQVQVNLTPQNMITQHKLPEKFYNDIDSPNGGTNDSGDTLQNLEHTRYANKAQGKPQIYHHPTPNIKRRPLNSNRPLGQSYHYGSKLPRPQSILKETGTSPAFNVPQFVGLPSKTKPIPLDNGSPKQPYKPRPQQEEHLNIFASITPPKRPPQHKDSSSHLTPTFNPMPLLNHFYGSENDGEEDLSGDFSQAPSPSKKGENYWQTDSLQQDDDDDIDTTEDSDQKASSSLNVGIPTPNRADSTVPSYSPTRFNSYSSTKPTDQPDATSKTTSNPTTVVDVKLSMIGTESFLDPASVNAVNNMGELDIPPPTSSYTPPTIMRPPSPGRPFAQTKQTGRPPHRIKNDQKIVINPGDGFKLQREKEEHQAGLMQVSLSVDTMDVDIQRQKNSSTQTEAPFNPKYTKRTKKPAKTFQTSTKATPTTLSPPASTVPTPTLDLNKMEMARPSVSNQTSSAEIFDFHESMNPHNYDFVYISTEKGITLKEPFYDPTVMMTQRPGNTNLYPLVSEPSINLKPPSVSTLPQIESVMGLNPPPPPSPTVRVSTQHITTSMSPTVTTYKTINTTVTNRNPLIAPPLQTTQRPIKFPPVAHFTKPPLKYTPQSTSRPRTKPTYSYSTVTKPTASTIQRKTSPPTSKSPFTSKSPQTYAPETTSAPATIAALVPLGGIENTDPNVDMDISPTLSTAVKPGKISASESVDRRTKKPSHNDPKNGGTYEMPMFTLNQKILDEILIEGSEEDYNRKSTIKIIENQTEGTTMTRSEQPIVTDSHRQQSKKSQPPSKHLSTRTFITSRIIIPTKYLTNTHVLTVTTTKLSVLTSLGIPSTQTFTLTKTKTATLVDTVTETHTLLQPTRVTESHTTTTTQIIHTTDYHSNIQPTIEVVDPAPSNSDPQREPISTTTSTSSPVSNVDSNSIFVVMTDKKSQGGMFSINPTIIDTAQNINAIGGGSSTGAGGTTDNDNSIELDYDDNITFDLPTRDEEAETNEVNHVILGGVLIATPPKSSENNHLGVPLTSCRPSCKASRNEICQQVDSQMFCVCRPGFARMFPDRPCKPTYTYAMQIPIHRISKQVLHFKDQYRQRQSDDFKHLAGITHHAVDRMVMQSDLRDVYHGVHVTSFDATPGEQGILGKFLIQLSDNSDEKRLVDVFKKYLRQNNFSLGGTEIFTTKNGVNSLEVVDFNECSHIQFHDCSENSRCFNLQGTYTCSCQEGYADLSENSIYPGRICSAEVIGCEKCNYHGKCLQLEKNIPPVCECFHWYTGASCQLNLKILLIALIAVGTILFILLLFCILVTCTRRRKNNNMRSLMSGIHIIAPRNSRLSSKSLTIDKRAMIKDSSSETSQNSLPYVLKKESVKQSASRNKSTPTQQQQAPYRNINQRGRPSSTLVSSVSEADHRHNYSEQNDRSLTVMIPRAKYHHSMVTQSSAVNHTDNLDHGAHGCESQQQQQKATPIESTSKASSFHCNSEKVPIPPSKSGSSNHCALHTTSTGALVSAGFEVSATVGNLTSQRMSNSNINLSSTYESRGNQKPKLIGELHLQKPNYQDTHLQYNTYKEGEKFIDSMDVWLDTIQQNELTAEARSFDETTIQAPTKSLRSAYERQMLQSNGNDEANTMAERDIGSTFLLPHTHLYKPDRDSDISGFDSF